MKKTLLILALIAFAAFLGKPAFTASEPAVAAAKNRSTAIEAKVDELTR